MNGVDIYYSIPLKKRFAKDCNLPISVFDSPYFEERLKILDERFDCISKFGEFCRELSDFNSAEEYFAYYNSVKDSIINSLKGNRSFNHFNEANFPKNNNDFSNRNLYVNDNNGGFFISIDMNKANFSALRHYSDNIFNNCKTWEEFIGSFTDKKHIIDSKYIRQVVFGNCNPKKQIQYETFLMNTLAEYIKTALKDKVNIYSVASDEIIISYFNPNSTENNESCYTLDELVGIIKKCPNGIGNLVKVESFTLKKLGNFGWHKTGFNAITEENIDVFKGINSEIYPQIVKYEQNLPLTDNDLVFYHDGKLARFLEGVENPWKND